MKKVFSKIFFIFFSKNYQKTKIRIKAFLLRHLLDFEFKACQNLSITSELNCLILRAFWRNFALCQAR